MGTVGAWLAGAVLALGACAPPVAPVGAPATSAPAPVATGTAAPPAPAPPPPAASAAASGSETPWERGAVEPPPDGAAPWGVWIPSLGVAASLAPLGLDDAGALEVPDHPDVAGWYAGGPRPGEVGPTVVAGHVDSRTGPAVFSRLSELRQGDVAHLVYRDGFVVTYRVGAVHRHDKDDFPTGRVYGDTDAPTLRLITCGGSFDRRAGSYRDNVIVYADLVGTWRYDPATA